MDSTPDSILGHIFREPRLLAEALTHGSVSYESQRAGMDNQRLEFLGDAVLQLILSHVLFARLPEADEGRLTKTRAHVVSTKSLAALARRLGLGRFLFMGRGEEANGGRDRDSSLADALEAVIGAVYLDAGLTAAMDFVQRVIGDELEDILRGSGDSNPKGDLQEKLQAVNAIAPHYRILSQSGPDHAKTFEAAVSWQGIELGRGSGKSKKEAEVQAAEAALCRDDLASLLTSATP
ncbi:MAG: ribonuclease III [Verrucomicrobiaceae bacterium]|nr:ribonuclease III [Verrucomicrobiaceae bacterium]